MFLPSKIGLYGVAAAVLCGTILLAYRHYTGLVEDLTDARTSLELERVEAARVRSAYDDLQQDFHESQRVAAEASREARRLSDIFARHDLTKLALARPGLVERRVNDATERVRRLLECATDPGCDPTADPGAAAAGGVEGADPGDTP